MSVWVPVGWREGWGRMRPHLRMAVGICAGFCVVGLLLALLLPSRYTAVAELLPPGEVGGRSQLLTQLSAMAGIQGAVGQTSFGPLYPDVARSRVVLAAALAQNWEGHTFLHWFTDRDSLSATQHERLLLSTRRNLAGHLNPLTGLITLEFTCGERRLAAAFLSEVLGQMDDFFAHRLVSEARQKRLSIERRLAELSTSLAESEGALEVFLKTNRLVDASPSLQLTEARLRRDVTVNSALYVELKQQYEVARVEEVGTVPVLKLLSAPTPPLRRSSPKRLIICVTALAFGALAAGAYLRSATGSGA